VWYKNIKIGCVRLGWFPAITPTNFQATMLIKPTKSTDLINQICELFLIILFKKIKIIMGKICDLNVSNQPQNKGHILVMQDQIKHVICEI